MNTHRSVEKGAAKFAAETAVKTLGKEREKETWREGRKVTVNFLLLSPSSHYLIRQGVREKKESSFSSKAIEFLLLFIFTHTHQTIN